MKIIFSEVSKVDNSHLEPLIEWQKHKVIINGEAGQYHYKLLTYLSSQISDGLIFEFGTHYGTSSTALSVNKTNKIITYDIDNTLLRKKYGKLYSIKPQPKNVELRLGDIFKLGQENEMLEADLIFVDVDHLGSFEQRIYDFLEENNYKGILLLDDIYYNNEMLNFWNSISRPKWDISRIGHGTDISKITNKPAGTGIVDFNANLEIIDDLPEEE